MVSIPDQLQSCLSYSGARTGPPAIARWRKGNPGSDHSTLCHWPPCVGTILASPSSAQPPKRPFQDANGSTPLALLTTHWQRSAVLLRASPASCIAPVSGSWRPPHPSSPFHRPQPQLLAAAPQARMFSPHLHTWVRAGLSV